MGHYPVLQTPLDSTLTACSYHPAIRLLTDKATGLFTHIQKKHETFCIMSVGFYVMALWHIGVPEA